MRFCGKHNLHLISDEIYALSVWNNPELPEAALFKSVLSVPPKGLIDPSMLHVAWGLSKVILSQLLDYLASPMLRIKS